MIFIFELVHACLPISLFLGLNFTNYHKKGRVLHLGLMLISASYVNDNGYSSFFIHNQNFGLNHNRSELRHFT